MAIWVAVAVVAAEVVLVVAAAAVVVEALAAVAEAGGNFGGGGGGGGFGSFGGSNTGITKSTNAGINYTDKWGSKIDVTGSYFFSTSDNRKEQQSLTQQLFGDSLVVTR